MIKISGLVAGTIVRTRPLWNPCFWSYHVSPVPVGGVSPVKVSAAWMKDGLALAAASHKDTDRTGAMNSYHYCLGEERK